MTLDSLAPGCSATVESLELSPEDRTRVLGLGIVPGTLLSLLQPLPAVVVRLENSTIALEPELARGIGVRLTYSDCNLPRAL